MVEVTQMTPQGYQVYIQLHTYPNNIQYGVEWNIVVGETKEDFYSLVKRD